jgi:hypothetical protein
MGCENSRLKYLRKLKECSLFTIEDRTIEEIMMTTYCKTLFKDS